MLAATCVQTKRRAVGKDRMDAANSIYVAELRKAAAIGIVVLMKSRFGAGVRNG